MPTSYTARWLIVVLGELLTVDVPARYRPSKLWYARYSISLLRGIIIIRELLWQYEASERSQGCNVWYRLLLLDDGWPDCHHCCYETTAIKNKKVSPIQSCFLPATPRPGRQRRWRRWSDFLQLDSTASTYTASADMTFSNPLFSHLDSQMETGDSYEGGNGWFTISTKLEWILC